MAKAVLLQVATCFHPTDPRNLGNHRRHDRDLEVDDAGAALDTSMPAAGNQLLPPR